MDTGLTGTELRLKVKFRPLSEQAAEWPGGRSRLSLYAARDPTWLIFLASLVTPPQPVQRCLRQLLQSTPETEAECQHGELAEPDDFSRTLSQAQPHYLLPTVSRAGSQLAGHPSGCAPPLPPRSFRFRTCRLRFRIGLLLPQKTDKMPTRSWQDADKTTAYLPSETGQPNKEHEEKEEKMLLWQLLVVIYYWYCISYNHHLFNNQFNVYTLITPIKRVSPHILLDSLKNYRYIIYQAYKYDIRSSI